MTAFAFCWPPRTPEMKKEFKDESCKMIASLQDEAKVTKLLQMGKAVMENAQGERAITVLRTLADAAVLYRLRNDFPWKSAPRFPMMEEYVINSMNASRNVVNRMKRAIVSHIRREMNNFNLQAKQTVISQKAWISHAEELTEEFKLSKKRLHSFAEKLRSADPAAEISEKFLALDRAPQIDLMRYLWKNIALMDEQIESRRGRYSMNKLTASSPPLKLDQSILTHSLSDLLEKGESGLHRPTHINETVKKWVSQIRSVADDLQRKRKENTQMVNTSHILLFTDRVSDLLRKNSSKHASRVSELQEMNENLEREISRVKLSIASHKYRLRKCS